MNPVIPLDQMTTADKLRAIEEIWEDLLRTAGEVAPPAWHDDVLRAREARIREGAEKFTDWDEAKNEIRKRTR